MTKGVKSLIAVAVIIAVVGVLVLSFFLWKKSVLKVNYFGEASTEILDESATTYDSDKFVKVYADAGKDFVVLNLTDIHLSDMDYRFFTGEYALRDIKRLIAATQPDLITVSGDITCADSQSYSVRKFTDFMNSFKIPWAPVFGNHDGEAENINKEYLCEVMTSGEDSYCLMQKGPLFEDPNPSRGNRIGNYVITVLERGTDKLLQSLIMVDTGGSHMTDKQILWYKQVANTLKAEYNEAPSTAIMHIPTVEYYYAYTTYHTASGWTGEPGKNGAYGDCMEKEWVACERTRLGEGETLEENIYYQDLVENGVNMTDEVKKDLIEHGIPKNNGAFAAFRDGGVSTILCGHDHLNCFYCPYEGINLVYGLKLGMGSGFRTGYNGGTLLKLSGGTVTTEFYFL